MKKLVRVRSDQLQIRILKRNLNGTKSQNARQSGMKIGSCLKLKNLNQSLATQTKKD
jgi:hypothetical protein